MIPPSKTLPGVKKKEFFIDNFIVLLIGLPSDSTIWMVFILIFVS